MVLAKLMDPVREAAVFHANGYYFYSRALQYNLPVYFRELNGEFCFAVAQVWIFCTCAFLF